MDTIAEISGSLSALKAQLLIRLLEVRGQTMHGFGDPAPFYGDHLIQQTLGSLGSAPAEVAFSTFGAHQNSAPRHAKTFRGCLVGLDFILSCSLLAWHNRTPLSHEIPRICIHPRSFTHQTIEKTAQGGYFFFATLPGAITINIVRPSRAGGCSTTAISDKSWATSLRSWSAISG